MKHTNIPPDSDMMKRIYDWRKKGLSYSDISRLVEGHPGGPEQISSETVRRYCLKADLEKTPMTIADLSDRETVAQLINTLRDADYGDAEGLREVGMRNAFNGSATAVLVALHRKATQGEVELEDGLPDHMVEAMMDIKTAYGTEKGLRNIHAEPVDYSLGLSEHLATKEVIKVHRNGRRPPVSLSDRVLAEDQ